MKTYGLIGYPVKHSLSPAMHNAAFKKLKIGARYMLFEKSQEELAPFIAQLKLTRVSGFNVTVPYKETVMPLLDEVDEQARQIGAVNTVVNKDGRFIGYNTDTFGFITSLKSDLKCPPRGKNVFVIGAGGAARAIGFALAREKAREIRFYDILSERAKKLSQDIIKTVDAVGGGGNTEITFVHNMPLNRRKIFSGIKDADILVNASTCGMKTGDPMPIDPALLPKGIVVYDIIYNPSPTKFIEAVKARGMQAVNGLGMLLYQGAAAFELWTGKAAPIEVMRGALEEGLRECRKK